MKRKRSPSREAEETSPTTDQNIDLDKLIEDRKQEKQKALMAELQTKLRTIRNRTPTVNNEPFAKGTFERLKRNDILRNVLEYLTDPNDVTGAYFTCRTFAEILEERRMLMTLPQVLNVFKTKVDDALEFQGEEIGNVWYQNWQKICLDVRTVCKAWKKTVDFHSKIAWERWSLIPEWREPENPRSNVFIFENEESVDEATSGFINQGLVHSPIQAIFLSVNDRIPEPYYRKLMEYFKVYGSSVRFIDIVYGRPGNIAPSVREKFLCDMLKRMRNLKRLHILFHDDDYGDDQMPEGGLAFQNIQQGLIEYEVSSLESLEHFSCSNWETESFVSRILRKCTNLNSVGVSYPDPAEVETTNALLGLNLERFEGSPKIITAITSKQMTWPLTHLIISRTRMKVNASVILPAINRFRETLQHLHIWPVVKMDDNDTATSLRLELLHLKSIFIRNIRRGTLGFDELLPLKSLEKIIVERLTSVKYEDENALVKVKTYFSSGEMHKSNVWQCFPSLKRFQIQLGCTYYRPTQTQQIFL